MTKLSKIFGKRLPEIPTLPDPLRPHPHTSVGIEVELEGRFPNLNEMKMWRVEREGSLIDGVEFVSEPVWGTAISDALEELQRTLEDNEPVVTFRTSTHVHINCLDITQDQLIKMMSIYLLYEVPLFRLHGDRIHNIFCVPTHSSVEIQKAYASLYDYVSGAGRNTNNLRSKYAALNPNSLQTFGTLEFRHMAGCTDMGLVSDWINMLLQLKSAALRDVDMLNPREVWGDMLPSLQIEEGDVQLGMQVIDSINMWRK